jgi:hypothetical protein
MDTQQWLNHLLPLPKECIIEGSLDVDPAHISIATDIQAGPTAQQAADELRALCSAQTEPTQGETQFTIVLGIPDAQDRIGPLSVDADFLRSCPNAEQAYTIQPEGDHQLLIAALDERGLYYGACTLRQLLVAGRSAERIAVPRVRIRDWPDLSERGLWNFPDEQHWIPWLADMKLNFGKMASTQLATVRRGQPNSATIDRDLMLESRRRAFNYSPFILHLNFLHGYGLYQAYPELAGRGDSALTGRYVAHKEGNQHRAPCASQPVLVDILCEWMESIAAQDGLDISCWLSERPGQCACDACTAEGQFVLEARAFVRAWQRARQTYPDLQIRMFLSTTTLERDWRVLAELPPEVKIERACAMGLERVTHAPRDLFANPLYDRYARQGHWIASYDVPVGVNGDVDTPEFKLPQHAAHRVHDYLEHMHERGYQGAYGMIAWAHFARETDGFNIAALAEWSWNRRGRTTRQLAVAWATRIGLENPEAFAEWSELVGPIAFDVYDSEFPVAYSQNRMIELVQQRQRPYLGEGLFRYYTTPDAFGEKRIRLEQAAQHAADLPETYELETAILVSYIDLAECIWHIAEWVATKKLEEVEEQRVLAEHVAHLKTSGTRNVDAIRAWRLHLGPEPWHQRVYDAIGGTERTVREIARFVEERYAY